MDEMMNTVGSSSVRDVPWTTDDVRKSSHHWSLAGDAALLNKLQDIAQNLVSMTHKVQQEVDTLVQDTSASHSKLGNVINEFLMLSNTQFVENRVYDDEVTDATPCAKKGPSPSRTTEEQKTQIVAKVSEALRLGMSVIETAYEQLHVQNSDSEDENETGSRYAHEPILRPKDPYRCRPLPCVIGSSIFLEDDHVGLVAPVLSDEEHIEEDIKSVSSVEENIPKNNEVLPKDYSSEDDMTLNIDNGFSRSTERRDSEKSGDSDLFDPNKKDLDNVSEGSSSIAHRESGEIPTSDRIPKVTDFQKELASKLLPPNKRRSGSASDASVEGAGEVAGRKSSKSQVHGSSRTSSMEGGSHEKASASKNNLETGDEEDIDEDDGLFAPKKGLFSVKGRLFDDSADEEDLFLERKSSTTKKTKSFRKTDSRKASLEDHGSLSLGKSVDNLFDNDDGGSHHLFLDATPSKSLATKKEVKATDLLFDEVNDDSIFNITTTTKISTPTKKVLAGAVSMFGSSVDPLAMRNPLKQTSASSSKLESKLTVGQTAVTKKDSILDGTDDAGRPGSETSSRSSRSVSSARETKTVAGRGSPDPSIASRASTTLFAEEPEVDDLFSTAEVTKRKPIGGISLFDGGDDEEDDDIFAPVVKLDATKKNKVNVDQGLSESANNFFDDIFAQLVKPRESARKTSAAALFDDDIFSPTTSKKEANQDSIVTSKAETVQDKPKPPRKVSLFDDDDEDPGAPVDDLFGPTRSSGNRFGSSTTKISSAGQRQSLLFEDDESLLFGATRSSSSSLLFNEDNLEVDLFDQSSGMKDDAKPVVEASAKEDKNSATASSKKTSKTPEKTKEKRQQASTSSSNAKVARTTDESEDDLFADKSDDVLKKKPSSSSTLDKSGGESETISLSPKLPSKRDVESSRHKKDDDNRAEKSAVSLSVPDESSVESGNLAESPSRKKPPVGGVALFGGALTPVLKPKSSRDKSPVSSGQEEKNSSSTTKPELRPILPFGTASPILPRVNVATTKQAVDFENPVKANPLHNANKDRIKIPVKRRPPTRRGRQEAIRRSAIDMVVDDGDDKEDSEPEISATVSAPTTPLTPDSQKVAEFTRKLSRKVEEVDKPASSLPPSSNERLESPPPGAASLEPDAKSITASSKVMSPTGGEKCTKNDSSDSEGDLGLFGHSDKNTKMKKTTKDSSLVTSSSTLNKSLLSDLDSDSNAGDDLFSTKLKPAKTIAKSDADTSSLFGTSSSKNRPSKLGRGKSLFDDDDDDDDEDIFKSSSTRKSSSISSASKTSFRSTTKESDKKVFDDPLMGNIKD